MIELTESKESQLIKEAESEVAEQLANCEKVADFNQRKVLSAMQESRISEVHFASTTGYGYNDIGRDALEEVYAKVFKADAALVRAQMVSGTHALALALFGNLRPNDTLLSVTGTPYDTLHGVIGIRPKSGSLAEYGVKYEQVDFDYDQIAEALKKKPKIAAIQRSKGYQWRPSYTVSQIADLIAFIKKNSPSTIVMVDNCYGEFVEKIEPREVGADMEVGSLRKNPGGGLTTGGSYVVGGREYIENAASRLTAPGLGLEVGPSLGLTPSLMQGLFLAPQVV
jgi:cystathionine beta-lyase family protein involved in aluminum resistance